jgi:hypothetical protein
MKIIRHRVGNHQSTVRPAKAFVCITDANFCERAFFMLFRGYKINSNQVCIKEIISEKESNRRKLYGIS